MAPKRKISTAENSNFTDSRNKEQVLVVGQQQEEVESTTDQLLEIDASSSAPTEEPQQQWKSEEVVEQVEEEVVEIRSSLLDAGEEPTSCSSSSGNISTNRANNLIGNNQVSSHSRGTSAHQEQEERTRTSAGQDNLDEQQIQHPLVGAVFQYSLSLSSNNDNSSSSSCSRLRVLDNGRHNSSSVLLNHGGNCFFPQQRPKTSMTTHRKPFTKMDLVRCIDSVLDILDEDLLLLPMDSSAY